MNILVGFRISVVPRRVQCICCSATNISYGKRANHPMITARRHYSDDCEPLKCKVAIVTGGAKGIGYAIVEAILAAGAKVTENQPLRLLLIYTVVIGDVLKESCEKATCQLNEKFGENKALFQICDVRKKEDMENLFKAVKDKIGQLDVVVNNAGILADSRWEDTIAINAAGTVRGTLLGFKYMGTNSGGKGGVIINLSSILGLQPLHSSPVYVGTKHFVIGFTRSMGSEYFCKMTNVKVMAVCPGVTSTELISESSKGGLQGFGDLGKELACNLGSMPSQQPEKVGEAVIDMIAAQENGSVWVSEGCENYRANLPDRSTFKPPQVPPSKTAECSKKKDPCKKDPCKKDPCQKPPDPCGDPCAKPTPCKEDPCKKDPCK